MAKAFLRPRGVKTIKKKKTKNIKTLEADEILESSSSVVVRDQQLPTIADPMQQYLAEIQRYKVLDRKEEQRVARLYAETRSKEYAEILIKANLRFVVKVALEYSTFGAKLIDLIQEGNIGLMRAVNQYQPEKNVRLISYAVWWIRGYIQDYLMKQYSLVKIGTTQQQRRLFYQLQKHRTELDRMGSREGLALLSRKLGVPENELMEMHQRLSGRDLSLDYKINNEDDGRRLLDYQKSPEDERVDIKLGDMEEISQLNQSIDKLRPDLSEREIFMMDNRLLSSEPMTLKEIGEKYGVSKEAIRQMEVRLIEKVRKQIIEGE